MYLTSRLARKLSPAAVKLCPPTPRKELPEDTPVTVAMLPLYLTSYIPGEDYHCSYPAVPTPGDEDPGDTPVTVAMSPVYLGRGPMPTPFP